MDYIFGLVVGLASYQWMFKFMNIDKDVATPTAWVIGIAVIFVVNFVSALVNNKFQRNEELENLEKENAYLKKQNKQLQKELNKNNKEIDFFKK